MKSKIFHAIIHFAEANSRWKDYYDIYLLTETFEFESRELANAIRSTFDNRPAKLNDQIPPGLRESFAVSKQDEWELFLQKAKLLNDSVKDLMMVVNRIWKLLEYPLREALSDENLPMKRWKRGKEWK